MFRKRLMLNLAVALIAFAIGLLGSRARLTPPASHTVALPEPAVPLCSMPADLQKITNVQYCDLMRNPERYDGQIVRVDAIMLAQSGYDPIWDHVSLAEPRCQRELVVYDQFHLTSRTCPAVMEKLDSLLMRDDPVYPRKNAKVRVVGQFFSPTETWKASGQSHWESERFRIISVERAASIDEDR